MILEQQIKQYLRHWHGTPPDPARQYDYYRCEVCRGLVTWKHIRQGGCACGVGSRVRAAHLTLWEKCKILVMPWSL